MISVINERGELNEKCGMFSVSSGTVYVVSSRCICKLVTGSARLSQLFLDVRKCCGYCIV
jgi:hypothetical protein